MHAGRPKSDLHSKFQPVTGVLKLLPSQSLDNARGVQEPSVVEDENGLNIYYSVQLSESVNYICLATATRIEDAWTTQPSPVIGMGFGGAPANRQAHSSFVFKYDSYYYCLATNGYGFSAPGEDRNIYMYRSVDGVTFTDLGLLIDKSIIPGAAGFGNSCLQPTAVNGRFEMLVEASVDGVWKIFRLSSANIDSGWTYTNSMSGLEVVPGGMYGGPQLIYFGGTWHIFYHYGASAGNLPTYLGYATSEDLVTLERKETPMFAIEARPYDDDTDQIADPFVIEIGGKCYLLAEYCENAGEYHSQIWMWLFNGNFDELIS